MTIPIDSQKYLSRESQLLESEAWMNERLASLEREGISGMYRRNAERLREVARARDPLNKFRNYSFR